MVRSAGGCRAAAYPRPALEVTPGVIAREARYAPGSRIDPHEHPWAFIAYVVDGTVDDECRGRSDVRRAGAVRILPGGVAHANGYRGDGARCFVTQIDVDLVDVFARSAEGLLRAEAYAAGSAVSHIAGRMYEEYRNADDLSALAVDGLLRELVVAAARTDRAGALHDAVPPWLRRVRERLHDELRDPPPLDALAADAGVHPSRLVRSFRRHFRHTPASYVAKLRIEKARESLVGTSHSIARIAFDVGFTDQAHLTRRFRALTGTTPARYRAAHEAAAGPQPFETVSE